MEEVELNRAEGELAICEQSDGGGISRLEERRYV